MAVVRSVLSDLRSRTKGKKRKEKPKKGRKNYQKYLKSRHWQRTRNMKMARVGHRCEKCGAKATEVHHKTYKRVGAEKQTDLLAVCRECHRKLHKIKKPKTKRTATKRKRKRKI